MNGAGLVETPLVYAQVTYSVTFTETDLPNGTSWGVTVNSTSGTPASAVPPIYVSSINHTTTGTSVVFQLANGTYTYSIQIPSGYTSSAPTGAFAVRGGVVGRAVPFVAVTPPPPPTLSLALLAIIAVLVAIALIAGLLLGVVYRKYPVTFTQAGLGEGISWSVSIDQESRSSTSDKLTFQVRRGTHRYAIRQVPGWDQETLPYSGTVRVVRPVREPTLAFERKPADGTSNARASGQAPDGQGEGPSEPGPASPEGNV